MRAAIRGLDTPYPLGTLLPAIYQSDPAAMRWTAGFDDVLAPVIATLDCLRAYIDPMLAPDDFLLWLAGWFGTTLDENWPLHRQRAAVASSVVLYRQAGTATGLRALVELVTGGEVEVSDSGGVAWSQAPNTPLPGQDESSVRVLVVIPAGQPLDLKALDELVAAAKPAHVAHRVEVSEHDRLP
jgi:phage tail-like protein